MKRKSLLVITVLALTATSYASAASFSVGLGFDSFNYSDNYLSTHLAYVGEVAENLELELGGAFGIRVEENNEPSFFLPFQAGLGFVFPDIPAVDGVLGVGVTPAFNWGSGIEGFHFYLGPHIKAGVRVPVHPFMRWYVEVQQNLHIGKPAWINTSTRVISGINFFFGD